MPKFSLLCCNPELWGWHAGAWDWIGLLMMQKAVQSAHVDPDDNVKVFPSMGVHKLGSVYTFLMNQKKLDNIGQRLSVSRCSAASKKGVLYFLHILCTGYTPQPQLCPTLLFQNNGHTEEEVPKQSALSSSGLSTTGTSP